MDEKSGSTMADSAGSHPGSLHNVALGHASVAGRGGGSYGFNGSSSYVRIPNDDSLNAGSKDEVHVSFDLRTTTTPSKPDYDLFRKGQAPGEEYKIEMQPDGHITCHYKGSSGSATAENDSDLSDGKWHHVECVKGTSSVTLTIDGKTWSKSKDVGSITNSFDMIIGAYPSGDFYEGDMDEVVFQVGDVPVRPGASFTESRTRGVAPLSVDFKDTSSGQPTSWTWRFGDGRISHAESPSHRFTRPGTYTVRLTASNSVGRTSTTRRIVVAPDRTAPRGTFEASPTSAWASYTKVRLTQRSLGDNATPARKVRRLVNWHDGTHPQRWLPGTKMTHVYTSGGGHVPTVRLTDAAGNARVVAVDRVSVKVDTIAPTDGLKRPTTVQRASVSARETLQGRAADVGTGVRSVRLRLVEKRGKVWYAYVAGSESWVRAGSHTAALAKSTLVHVVPTDHQWSYKVGSLSKGLLEIRLNARDHVGNTSSVRLYRSRLTQS
jgi:PKD repeat protein